MAIRHMRRQDPKHTLQTTDLIHEAYLRLISGPQQTYENRAHFFAVAAKVMRRVLVDHARARQAAKRGGVMGLLPLDEGVAVRGGTAAEVVALDDALTALGKLDARKAEVVELRYFGGLSVEDAARALNISRETVQRDWRFSKSFLQREVMRTGHC
jgi:RNA polymerase sigma factor (TIGR02999 family)